MKVPKEPNVIHVLVVDDESLICRELRRALEAKTGADFDFQVCEAKSLEEYHRYVCDHHADVMILDVQLVDGEDGLDEVLSFHRLHSPDTIVIVYSSFPSSDPLRTCVRAMRAGALDCIDKRIGMKSIDDVVQSVLEELRRRTSGDFGPSSEWLKMQWPMLVAKYGGKAVAIVGNEVILAAATISELRSELAKNEIAGEAYTLVVPKTEN